MKYDIFVTLFPEHMLRKVSLFLLLLLPLMGFSSHLRSAEISYTPDPTGPPNTYIITITVYTNVGFQTNGQPTPDIPSLSLMPLTNTNTTSFSFGDGTTSPNPIFRSNGNGELDPNDPKIKKNIFIVSHTFPGNGTYTISLAASARNGGIANIPPLADGSLQALYVASMLTISDKITPFSSPVLTDPPLGNGCINNSWTVNPGAVDPDGDILKYVLINCEVSKGTDVSGYLSPQDVPVEAGSTFNVDPKGTITWDKLTSFQGTFNIAIRVEKWRKVDGKNLLIGWVIRDWQIIIAPCPDVPPYINPIPDMCVLAGETLTYDVTSSSKVVNDILDLTWSGTPFDVLSSQATFTLTGTNVGSQTGTFNWNTNFSHFRKNPYQAYYKVYDKTTGLSFPASNWITILASPVKNVTADAKDIPRGINVKWEQSVYTQAIGYNIYRKTGPSTVPFDKCTTGVPLNSGYELIGTVPDPTKLTFTDLGKGTGLPSGYTYCYIVTALFADGAESSPSEPTCSLLSYPFIEVVQDALPYCKDNTITIDESIIKFINADNNTIYTWSSDPGLQLTDADKQQVIVKMLTTGPHVLKIVSKSGSYIDEATINIQVNPLPTPKIEYTDLGGVPKQTVIFYNKSINADIAEWDIDGTKSSDWASATHVFDKNGNYDIKLTVYNSLYLCPVTTTISFRALMKGVEMPNAFEPENTNADLKSFKPKAIGLQTYFFGVWDLWGNLVWSSDRLIGDQPDGGWDGNDSKGRKMPSQNYIWRMKATFIDGTVWKGIKDGNGKFHSEGTFTLLR